MISGGSNGIVYSWRKGSCIAHCQAIRGGINCLVAVNDKIFCGGPRGILKVLKYLSLVFALKMFTLSVSTGARLPLSYCPFGL